jgi:hypothetical protein
VRPDVASTDSGYVRCGMLLFKKPFWDGLIHGTVTVTFRRWEKPHVRAGGRYRCHPIGVLEVDDIRTVTVGSIGTEDARGAGFASREELVSYLRELGPLDDSTPVYRVALHYGGDGDRVALALEDKLTAEDVEGITAKLARMDGKKPWTQKTLALIATHPRVAASKLAPKLGRETPDFKANVVKLKKLGLTQSFEIGYEIAPRGRAYLDATRRRRKG